MKGKRLFFFYINHDESSLVERHIDLNTKKEEKIFISMTFIESSWNINGNDAHRNY